MQVVFLAFFFHTWDRINPFDGQKERFFQLSFGQRNIRIHNLQQFHHCIHTKLRFSVLRWSKTNNILSDPIRHCTELVNTKDGAKFKQLQYFLL